MRKPAIIYYVAASLDGFIAGPNDELDWLPSPEGWNADEAGPFDYPTFLATVDALVMGRRTYDICRGFGEWPYPDHPAWVISRSPIPEDLPTGVTWTSEGVQALVADLSDRGHQRVWLEGGGTLAAEFLANDLISDVMLTTIPVLLGTGIPLFANSGGTTHLRRYHLVGSRVVSGNIVCSHYQRQA